MSTNEAQFQLPVERHRLLAALARVFKRGDAYIPSVLQTPRVLTPPVAAMEDISIPEAIELELRLADARTRLRSRTAVASSLLPGNGALRSRTGSSPTKAGAAASNTVSKSLRQLDSIAYEEQIRLTQQLFLGGNSQRIVVFCGLDNGNGCSQVCAETAVALAGQISETVCVVDANFRSPTLHKLFGLTNEKGFAEAILDPGDLREYSVKMENLWIMPSGARRAKAQALLASQTLRQCIETLRQTFDFILIDAPPLNHFTDGARLGTLTDGVVMVLEANSTRREAARNAAGDLKAANTKILAAVLNKRTFPIPESIYRKL